MKIAVDTVLDVMLAMTHKCCHKFIL